MLRVLMLALASISLAVATCSAPLPVGAQALQCAGFQSQAAAQFAFDTYIATHPERLTPLDADGDGAACEDAFGLQSDAPRVPTPNALIASSCAGADTWASSTRASIQRLLEISDSQARMDFFMQPRATKSLLRFSNEVQYLADAQERMSVPSGLQGANAALVKSFEQFSVSFHEVALGDGAPDDDLVAQAVEHTEAGFRLLDEARSEASDACNVQI